MNLLLGHLVGDFLLQNKWMAMNKGASHAKCFVHCLLYTVAVCVICHIPDWRWPLIVFLSHYPIDRWSLADKWLKLIRARSLTDFLQNGHKGIPLEYKKNYHILRGGFTGLVYCVADNTMHLLLLYYGRMWIS